MDAFLDSKGISLGSLVFRASGCLPGRNFDSFGKGGALLAFLVADREPTRRTGGGRDPTEMKEF